MITEIATLTVDPARAAEFETAVAQAAPFFKADTGCHGMSLEQVIEVPGTYHLRVLWDSVEAHTVGFRGSDNFQQWRALAGPFFTAPPQVIHCDTVAVFF